jgi:Tfp pilus assembly PilM family ATPase
LLFQTSLGIDIGTDQVSLVYLKRTFRDMTLVDYDTRPIGKEKSAEEKLNIVKEHVNGFIWKPISDCT